MRIIRLTGQDTDLVIGIADHGMPMILHFGPCLGDAAPDDAALAERAVAHGMTDTGEHLDCLPQAGHGFSGTPGLVIHRNGRGSVTQARVRDVEQGPHHAVFHLVDDQSGLAAVLRYDLDPETGVLKSATCVTNAGCDPLNVEWVAALCLPGRYPEILSFAGRWTFEFQLVRLTPAAGRFAGTGRTGRTSHHAPPYLVTCEAGTNNTRGRLLAVHLAWSGNHEVSVERLRDGRIQIQAGEVLGPGEVILAPGASYETPSAYAAWSHTGLNGLSDRFHRFVRQKILPPAVISKPRPVHFNTWEAVYFDQDEPRMFALADQAAALGVERFVVDDGWFQGRDNDRKALGDWRVDRTKYPDGLKPLIDHVHALGMEFGLWVEPEMVNRDSDLFRAHPDWILGDAGRDQPLGRGQYVLDLTRDEVFENVFSQVDRLLSDHRIEYLKWDMNRDITHGISGGRQAVRQQTLAVYRLMDRLREKFPCVEIESCASGGARADLEVLKRTHRIWTSDCNDPIDRCRIQHGASIFLPPVILGSHVGPRTSHTNGRVTSMAMRALTAMFGHFGVEGDPGAMSEAERAELARWISVHKTYRKILHTGRFSRLDTNDPGLLAHVAGGANCGDGDYLVSATQTDSPLSPVPSHLTLDGYVADGHYAVRLLNPGTHPERRMKYVPGILSGSACVVSGASLNHIGLPLPVLMPGTLAVFHLERVR